MYILSYCENTNDLSKFFRIEFCKIYRIYIEFVEYLF